MRRRFGIAVWRCWEWEMRTDNMNLQIVINRPSRIPRWAHTFRCRLWWFRLSLVCLLVRGGRRDLFIYYAFEAVDLLNLITFVDEIRLQIKFWYKIFTQLRERVDSKTWRYILNPTDVQASAHTLYGPVLDVGFWLPPGAMSLLEQWSILLLWNSPF